MTRLIYALIVLILAISLCLAFYFGYLVGRDHWSCEPVEGARAVSISINHGTATCHYTREHGKHYWLKEARKE